MCSVSRGLLRFKRLLECSSFSDRNSGVARRLIHVNHRLLKSDADDNRKESWNLDGEEVMTTENGRHNLPGIIPPKYKLFRDEDAPIIFDVDEERDKMNLEELNAPREELDIFEGISLERGVDGVYDIGDLVDVLNRNNVMELFVATVPAEMVYVDYIVIVTGRSPKHMKATAEIVRRVFKKKRRSTDGLPQIEGKNSKDWIAMDLGNIVLHIFSQQTRKLYDLETLWSVGSEYDDQSNMPVDGLAELFEQHSYLAGLQPAKVSN